QPPPGPCRRARLLSVRTPPCSALFPYTTLFRSVSRNVFCIAGDLAVQEALFWQELARRDSSGHTAALRMTKVGDGALPPHDKQRDRKSTRLNSSHQINSYALFCLKQKSRTRETD